MAFERVTRCLGSIRTMKYWSPPAIVCGWRSWPTKKTRIGYGSTLLGRFHRQELLPLGLGFVAGSDLEVVVAFAGTRDGIDWAFNAVHSLTPGYSGRVHKGFAHLAEHVGDAVIRAVKQARTSGQRVVLTGHSRGGALAVLTAFRLGAASIEPEHVFTFGAPRIGDAAFAFAYPSLLHCIEATHDPVPSLPPGPDYQAVRERLLLTQEGRVYRTDGKLGG